MPLPLCASVTACHVIHTFAVVFATISPSISLPVNCSLIIASLKQKKANHIFLLIRYYIEKYKSSILWNNPLITFFKMLIQIHVPFLGVGVTLDPLVAG